MTRKSTTHILGLARKSSGFIPGPGFRPVVNSKSRDLFSVDFRLDYIIIILFYVHLMPSLSGIKEKHVLKFWIYRILF